MGKLFATHSTWIQGAKSFGEWLTRIPGVAYVNQGHVRSSHVKPGKRRPTVTVGRHSITVGYFSGGQLQYFFVFKLSKIKWTTLEHRINRAIDERQKRGGIGESSKAEIEVPERIKRQAVADEAKRLAASAGEPVVLPRRVAQAYDILLRQFPEAQKEHQLIGLYRLLAEHLSLSTVRQVVGRLTSLGLVVSGKKLGFGKEKSYTIHRKPYTVGRVRRAHAPSDRDTLVDHVEEIIRRIRCIEQLGFTVEVRDGQVHFTRSTRSPDSRTDKPGE
ncbi:MAG: hypothetical protein HY566_00390 [Candidatus Kerfeldbacteria bacterium]|nr:hypothetical protein [Candidatus Kerfeldbacteria bacterium]